MIKASIYASKNLCYHLDDRHKRTEDGYSKATDTEAWGKKIKELTQYKRELLTKELNRYLKAPMCVDSLGSHHSPLADRPNDPQAKKDHERI